MTVVDHETEQRRSLLSERVPLTAEMELFFRSFEPNVQIGGELFQVVVANLPNQCIQLPFGLRGLLGINSILLESKLIGLILDSHRCIFDVCLVTDSNAMSSLKDLSLEEARRIGEIEIDWGERVQLTIDIFSQRHIGLQKLDNGV